MKSILLAGIIGMIFFQSCTKENSVRPLSLKSTGLTQDQKKQTDVFKMIKPVKDNAEEQAIIKCGTVIPADPKIILIEDGSNTPIYIPASPTEN